jgi:hypothetical protein
MATRVTLNPGLPPQTAAYKRFEKTNIELNRFYWTFRCATDHLLPAIEKVARVRDLIGTSPGQQLDITSAQFVAEYPATERIARHSFLVLAVTAFEDYMRDALTSFLVKNWKPEKTYRLSFRPQDLPDPASTHDWLRERTVRAIVDDYLGRSYEKRYAAVSSLVVEYGASSPALPQEAQTLSAQACEARNNIVHSSGVVDTRAAAALEAVIPGLSVGVALNVSEQLLWKFLGALRDSARALDVELRGLPA